jgi:hypothetical protein
MIYLVSNFFPLFSFVCAFEQASATASIDEARLHWVESQGGDGKM